MENMMFFDERIIPPGYREIKLRPTSFEAKNKLIKRVGTIDISILWRLAWRKEG